MVIVVLLEVLPVFAEMLALTSPLTSVALVIQSALSVTARLVKQSAEYFAIVTLLPLDDSNEATCSTFKSLQVQDVQVQPPSCIIVGEAAAKVVALEPCCIT